VSSGIALLYVGILMGVAVLLAIVFGKN